jgi:hypothetical protein
VNEVRSFEEPALGLALGGLPNNTPGTPAFVGLTNAAGWAPASDLLQDAAKGNGNTLKLHLLGLT